MELRTNEGIDLFAWFTVDLLMLPLVPLLLQIPFDGLTVFECE